MTLGTLRDQIIYPSTVPWEDSHAASSEAPHTSTNISESVASSAFDSQLETSERTGKDDAKSKKMLFDIDLIDLLHKVQLGHLLAPEENGTRIQESDFHRLCDGDKGDKVGRSRKSLGLTLDSVCDWHDTLSGGEKQRLSLARMYYQRPVIAFLDECTSAVSEEVEDSLYEYCSEYGITLVTVSHRSSAKKHHDMELHLTGDGQYTLRELLIDQ
jgi:ABC-type uncharacterized transport system fused permease/ATPase subunit